MERISAHNATNYTITMFHTGRNAIFNKFWSVIIKFFFSETLIKQIADSACIPEEGVYINTFNNQTIDFSGIESCQFSFQTVSVYEFVPTPELLTYFLLSYLYINKLSTHFIF